MGRRTNKRTGIGHFQPVEDVVGLNGESMGARVCSTCMVTRELKDFDDRRDPTQTCLPCRRAADSAQWWRKRRGL